MHCAILLKNLIILVASFIVIITPESLFKPRVLDGVDDVNNEFPYVISLETSFPRKTGNYRACTGTYIAQEWVLTAAHCLMPIITTVRYGNMTISRNETESMTKILKMIPHPSFQIIESVYAMKNDIGLILTQKIQMTTIGKLSAIDSDTLTGFKVRYAGFGLTSLADPSPDNYKPLQLGEGIVIRCSHKAHWSPAICVVSHCSKRHHDAAIGDSGGPVFYDGKIVAVVSGVITPPEGIYTPISPYLDWIKNTILDGKNFD